MPTYYLGFVIKYWKEIIYLLFNLDWLNLNFLLYGDEILKQKVLFYNRVLDDNFFCNWLLKMNEKRLK